MDVAEMSKYPPLIYVAAPYSARTLWEIEQNVQFATEIGHLVMINGMSPIVPHVMYRHYIGGMITERYILDTVKEVMRRCDAVYVAGQGWSASNGVSEEVGEAKRLRIPIFYDSSTGFQSGLRAMKRYFDEHRMFEVHRRDGQKTRDR